MNKTLVSALAIAVVAGGAWFLTRPVSTVDPLLGAALAQDVQTDESLIVEMVEGDPDAALEVIEYASFTCPHCADFHDNQYQQLKENYIDTGLIRFVYREIYFDRPGLWASMVARCGGEMRYFGIADMIFERQGEWARRETGQEIATDLRNIGKVAGLTDEQLDTCMGDAVLAQSLVGWSQSNAEADDVRGTPSFVINGETYTNMSYTDFAAILDAKLAETEGTASE